jgi:Glycosyltransferase family 92
MSVALPPPRCATWGSDGHEIAIAAIFFNEAEYLKEWIEFHLMVGVDRFYLYDNGSSDGFSAILEPYCQAGQVLLLPWSAFIGDASAQRLAYAHAARNCAPSVRWLAFIDIDEFLFSETGDDIRPVFAKLEGFAALTIPRFEFGPNGHKEKPEGLVIENYTRVGQRDLASNSNMNSKAAIQPALAEEIGTHICLVAGDTLAIEPVGSEPVELRINHYFSKSDREFENKMQRGYSWKDQRGKRIENVVSKKYDLLKAILDNDGGDYSMAHFVERLKPRI